VMLSLLVANDVFLTRIVVGPALRKLLPGAE